MIPTGSIIWCDWETSGLEPAKDKPLEIAIVITDWELRELWSYQALVQYTREELNAIIEGCHERVYDMHDKSGLWLKLLQPNPEFPPKTLEQIQTDILQIMTEYGCMPTPRQDGSGTYRAPLAGSSVQFDRKWLDYYLPKVTKVLSYRNIDVSTIMQLVEVWYEDKRPELEGAHRAIADIRGSIDLLKRYRSRYFTPYCKASQGRPKGLE